MKACTFSIAAMVAVSMMSATHAHAQDAGMAYNWRAPGAYFGEPVPISDRDESSTSQSSFRVAYTAEPVTDVRSRDILAATYTVAPNAELGYAYAGFAVPFNTPMALAEDAAFQFEARSPDGIERLELILRDTSRRRVTHVVKLAPSSSWSTVTVPAVQLAAIDKESIQSAAIVVLSPGSGMVEISNMRLPVRALVTELSILEEIRTAPKWHLNSAMAMHVARRLQQPLLVLVDSSESPSRLILQGEAWANVLSKTVNLRITGPEGIVMPEDIADTQTTESRFYLFSPDGLLMTHGPAVEGAGRGGEEVLSQWSEGSSQ